MSPEKFSEKTIEYFKRMAVVAETNNQIDPELYKKFNVKRGLRNEDGSGVCVGLTDIGDVHGYIVDEGEKVPVDGRLRYRGIDIRDIVNGFLADNRHGYEEVAYLLIFGKLPTKEELTDFKETLGFYRPLSKGFTENMILKNPSSDIMNKLGRSVLVSYSYDLDPEGRSLDNILRQSFMMIGSFPTMVAYGYQAKAHYYDGKSLHIHHTIKEGSTAENLLRLVRPNGVYTPLEADLLDLALVLHAEHGGGNNSTFSTHLVSSADTDVYSSVAAAVGSLKGFKHGGANIRVVQMMDDIKENVKDWSDEKEVAKYIEKIITKQAFDRTGLVYGMGHAVYTLSDPRERILNEQAEKLAREKNKLEEYNLYKLVQKITPLVFQDVKETDKVISANVDFYSGFVYTMLGIPYDLFTPIFAIARVAGWCAHIIEEKVSGGRIMRPAYKNISKPAQYIHIDERKQH